MSSTTLVKEISSLIGLSEEALVESSIAAYLREKKRLLMAEQFEILTRYQATSREEIRARIEQGQIHDHPAWEDYIELTNLAKELQRTEDAIDALAKAA